MLILMLYFIDKNVLTSATKQLRVGTLHSRIADGHSLGTVIILQLRKP
jgi:hypothetical protein